MHLYFFIDEALAIQDEFYAVAFRKKRYNSIDELQIDLDQWIDEYNQERTHTGKYCYGKTPMQTFIDSIPLAKEKYIDKLADRTNFAGSDEALFSIKQIPAMLESKFDRNNLIERGDKEVEKSQPLLHKITL